LVDAQYLALHDLTCIGCELAVGRHAVEQLHAGHERPEQAAKIVPQFRVALPRRFELLEGSGRSPHTRFGTPQRRGGLLRGEGGEWHGETARR